MSRITREETFDVSAKKFYQAIIDYNSYPDFVDGVDGIEVLEESDSGARVEYSINMIKKFRYVLNLTHTLNEKISWEFESGDLFKENSGAWALEAIGENQVRVEYWVDVNFKGFVPKSIVNKLVSKNLPEMMKAYAKRAGEL